MKLLKCSVIIVTLYLCGTNFISNVVAEPEPDPNIIDTLVERGKDMLKAIPDTGMRLANVILDFIPTPEAIFNLNKQLLVAVPIELIAYAIDQVCSAAVSINAITPTYIPNANEMNFEFITQDNDNISVSITDPEELWRHSKFRKDWNVTLFITGWNSDINETNDALEVMYAAYRLRDINFVVLDAAQFVNTLYIWSAFNTEAIGNVVGNALVGLTKYIDVSRIHLIGHSLGAHMVGYAGRSFNSQTDQLIPRITGLDPARPCFSEGERLDGLRPGDAEFVDIIHSNPGILGIRRRLGDVDFYPNGKWSSQPGCLGIVCSHSRSYEYYAETVIPKNERNFLSVRCVSFSSYMKGRCRGKRIPMGIACPKTARGEYVCKTNKFKPYGISTPPIIDNMTANHIPERHHFFLSAKSTTVPSTVPLTVLPKLQPRSDFQNHNEENNEE